MGQAMSNDSANKTPIVFLLGTSTAGKTTICKEIINQSKENPVLKDKVEIWGHDQESQKLFDKLGVDMLQDDNRFTQITQISQTDIITAIYDGNFTDHKSGKTLSFKEDEFAQNIDQFLKDTDNRYDLQTMTNLKGLAQDEMASNSYKDAVMDLARQPEKITKSAIDHAIENSKNGIATILDGVPLGFMKETEPTTDHRVVEKMEQYLKDQECTSPTQVALVHLHPNEMALRMAQRNIEASAPGGDKWDRRDGLSYYEAQYGQLFGKVNEDGQLLDPPQEIHRQDIYDIAEKFGSTKVNDETIKIRDLTDVELRQTAIESEGKKVMDAIGFDEGMNSLTIGSKVKTDVIFDHQQQSSTEISSEIVGFIAHNMNKQQDVLHEIPKEQKAEDLLPSKRSWRKMISDDRQEKDNSQIVR